jgi:phosphatidate cytidylyltransferase
LHFSYIHIIALGLIFGVIGQLGDLSESLIKRDCEVKDSGKVLPGMGGILDEIDSLLFTAPVFYFYVSSFVK